MTQATFKNKPQKGFRYPDFWHRLFARKLPKAHFYAAMGVAVALVFSLSLLPSESVEAKRKTIELEITHRNGFSDSALLPEEIKQAELEEQAASELIWHEQIVKNGDNLTTLFKRESLGAAEVHKLVTSTPLAKQLTRLKPGEALEFGFDETGELQQISYTRSRLESLVFTREGESFHGEEVIRTPEISRTFRQTIIDRSLYVDAEKALLPHNQIMALANIFGWDIDFALDIRKGDSFSVLYEEKYLDGELVGTGNILAASFTNQGKTYKAVRFTDENGFSSYYDPNGRVMRKAFLRAPLDFTRVSSNFNPNRLHPVFKTKRPHRGVDYAAPRGTPVYAAGDGKVIASGYSKANGNYVFIKHGQKYITKYLHLDKRRVKTGQRVSQSNVIGTVGSTGYATGPHLHYEFVVNGVHRNPRTVKLPEAEPLPENQRQAFIAATTPLMAQLDRLSINTQLAAAPAPSPEG